MAMTDVEKTLLELAYQARRKPGSGRASVTAHNPEEILRYSNALEYLGDEQYIVMLTDNVDDAVLSIFAGDLLFEYEITPQGIRYWKENQE